MGYGQADARGYVNARDGQDAYRKLLQDLGMADRRPWAPFETLRDPAGPFEQDGEAWDASLSERDPGAIRYANGERFREVIGES